jgi:hypothetical protein
VNSRKCSHFRLAVFAALRATEWAEHIQRTGCQESDWPKFSFRHRLSMTHRTVDGYLADKGHSESTAVVCLKEFQYADCGFRAARSSSGDVLWENAMRAAQTACWSLIRQPRRYTRTNPPWTASRSFKHLSPSRSFERQQIAEVSDLASPRMAEGDPHRGDQTSGQKVLYADARSRAGDRVGERMEDHVERLRLRRSPRRLRRLLTIEPELWKGISPLESSSRFCSICQSRPRL